MAGKCPECGTRVNADPGKPTGQHQKPGSRERCPGVGQPADPE